MSNPWTAIGAFALVGLLIPLGMVAVSSILRPSVPEQGKRATYESGEVPTGSSLGIQFNIQYYTVALLFVVFDIETDASNSHWTRPVDPSAGVRQ